MPDGREKYGRSRYIAVAAQVSGCMFIQVI